MNLTQLGPYRIEEELGHGGMATVYRAYHVPLRRYVALKVLDSLLSRDTEFQQRFEQEATVAAQLEHPNIVSIYDLGMVDDHQYIAMRLIDGPTLEQVIRDEGPMPAQRALSIAAEISDALACAHGQGVFHRDVKPSNIILRPDGHPVLTDFGIARAVEGLRLTMSQSVVGTPRYMSPEQAQAQPVDHRSDIYSLGVVLYEMLSGQPPFNSPSTPSLLYLHVHEPPPPLSQFRPDLAAGVRELVEVCLAKSPDDRFQSAEQVAATCRSLLTIPRLDASDTTMVLPAISRPASTPRPGTPPTSRPAMTPGASPPVVRPATPPPGQVPGGTPSPGPQTSQQPAPVPVAPAPRRIPMVAIVGGILTLLVVAGAALMLAGDRLPGRTAAVPTETARPVAVTAQAKPTAVQASIAAPVAAAPSPIAAASPTVAPDSAARHLAEAMNALGRREYQAALDQTTAGLKLDPKDAGLAKAAVQARLGLGDQLWSRGDLQQALTQFLMVREQPLRGAASAAELRQAELSAPYIWGLLTWNVDQVVALAEYQKVYKLDPGFRDIRDKVYTSSIALAGQLIAQGNRDGALNYLNTARGVDPNRPEATALLRSLTPTP